MAMHLSSIITNLLTTDKTVSEIFQEDRGGTVVRFQVHLQAPLVGHVWMTRSQGQVLPLGRRQVSLTAAQVRAGKLIHGSPGQHEGPQMPAFCFPSSGSSALEGGGVPRRRQAGEDRHQDDEDRRDDAARLEPGCDVGGHVGALLSIGRGWSSDHRCGSLDPKRAPPRTKRPSEWTNAADETWKRLTDLSADDGAQ